MQPTTREMQAMAAAGQQISLDDLRAAAGGVHDDFLDQMLGGLPPSAWPELSSAAGGKAPDGGAQAEGMEHQPQHFGGGLYDGSLQGGEIAGSVFGGSFVGSLQQQQHFQSHHPHVRRINKPHVYIRIYIAL